MSERLRRGERGKEEATRKGGTGEGEAKEKDREGQGRCGGGNEFWVGAHAAAVHLFPSLA